MSFFELKVSYQELGWFWAFGGQFDDCP